VYFKSGSLYSCQAEEGFKCGKYKGNKRNYMNSVAIVEADAEGKRLHYIVTLVSNVLRENAAVAHQTLGTQIHQLMKQRHGVAQ
jgi:acid stress-induced BolA-like protein IbaG/YrbA